MSRVKDLETAFQNFFDESIKQFGEQLKINALQDKVNKAHNNFNCEQLKINDNFKSQIEELSQDLDIITEKVADLESILEPILKKQIEAHMKKVLKDIECTLTDLFTSEQPKKVSNNGSGRKRGRPRKLVTESKPKRPVGRPRKTTV